MGNCLRTCRRYLFKRFGRRRFRGRGDEMGFLVDDDEDGSLVAASPVAPPTSAVTEREKLLLKSRNYDALMNEQRALDAQIDEQLRRHEEELRRQEEAARNAASARASQQRQQALARLAAAAAAAAPAAGATLSVNPGQLQPKSVGSGTWQQQQPSPRKAADAASANGGGAAGDSWLSDDDEWNVAGGEDFGKFLDHIGRKSANGGDGVGVHDTSASALAPSDSLVADRQPPQVEPATIPKNGAGGDSLLQDSDGRLSEEEFVSAQS